MERSESVLQPPEAERFVAAVHRANDGVSNHRILDGARLGDTAPVRGRLELDHLVRVAVHDDVGVVGGDDDLPPSLEPLEGGKHRLEQEAVSSSSSG